MAVETLALLDAADRARRPAAAWSCATRVEIVSRPEDLDRLQPEWDALLQRAVPAAHMFQTFNWTWHWTRRYLGGDTCDCELAVVAVRDAGQLVAIIPLMLVRRFGLRLLKALGEPVSQYADVIVAGGSDRARVLDAGFAHAVQALRADALYIRKVRSDAELHTWLVRQGASLTLREEAPYLDLASATSYESYIGRYSAKARKNRRRLARRLEGLGQVRVARLRGGQAARQAVLAAIELKRRLLLDAGNPAPALQDCRFAQFFADAAEGRTHACDIGVTWMSVDDQLAACLIDVGTKDQRAAHVLVHNPAYASCGPGMLVVEEWTRSAQAEGVTRLDLLAPAHAYKLEFADGVVAVEDYVLPITLKGRGFAAYARHLRPALKRAYEHAARARTRLAGPAKPPCCNDDAEVS